MQYVVTTPEVEMWLATLAFSFHHNHKAKCSANYRISASQKFREHKKRDGLYKITPQCPSIIKMFVIVFVFLWWYCFKPHEHYPQLTVKRFIFHIVTYRVTAKRFFQGDSKLISALQT